MRCWVASEWIARWVDHPDCSNGIHTGAVSICKQVGTGLFSSLPRLNPSPHLNAPGKWRYFISYTPRNPAAQQLALELFKSFTERKESVWLDIKMSRIDSEATKEGVLNSDCVVAIVSGGDFPEDRYFGRDACLRELALAVEHQKTVVPVVDVDDRHLVKKYIAEGIRYGIDLSSCDFVECIRSNVNFFKASLDRCPAQRRGETIVDMVVPLRAQFMMFVFAAFQMAHEQDRRRNSKCNPRAPL